MEQKKKEVAKKGKKRGRIGKEKEVKGIKSQEAATDRNSV